jgi:hypothetical protein
MPVLPRSSQKMLLAGAVLLGAGPLGAQMPGMPTLQNAWANPGITAAVNGGMGGGSRAFGAAAAWAPRSGRFQLSAGAGLRQSDDFGNGPAFGARLAMPVFSFAGGALGVAGFLGAGAAREPDRTTPDGEGAVVAQVPVGAAIGYRRAFSFIRGASIYGAPFYMLNRITVGDSSWNKSAFRFSVGTDVGITDRIGVTAGAEFGGSAGVGEPGPTGAVYGLGVSMAFGRR